MNKKIRKNGYFCKECGHRKWLYQWFKTKYCLYCKRITLNNVFISVSDSIKIRDSIRLKKNKKTSKRFLDFISGWSNNTTTKDSKYGVDKKRIIDKEKNEYHEVVKDLRTGKIIRDCHEPLTKHKKYKKRD